MFSALKLIALTAVASAVELTQLPRPLTAVQAGALEMYVNTTSVNNMLQTFVPILSYYMLNNKTFDVDYHSKDFFYQLDVDSVHVNTVSGFTTKLFEMVPGTDKLFCNIGGIDADVDLNGSLKLIKLIPLTPSGLSVKNMNISFTLESVAAGDKVHWKLVDSSNFHFDSIKINMKNRVLQKIVDLSSGTIAKMVNKEFPKLSQAIDGVIQNLNKNIANEGPLTFAVPLMKNAAVNLTMTQSPDLSNQDLIKLYFDGLILENNKTSETVEGIVAPPRLEHSLSEQIWLHENMVDSLLDAGAAEIFPQTLASKSISDQMKQVFSEIPAFYGKDVEIALKLNMETGEGKAINFDTQHGIVLGDKSEVATTIDILCSNSTTANETAATLQMNFETHLNLTILNFVVYPNVQQIYVANATVVKDNIGMWAHNYNMLFTNILHNVANDLNMKYKNGYALANIDPVFGLLGGLIKGFTVSPFFAQDFMFIGFEMQADLPTITPEMLIQK